MSVNTILLVIVAVLLAVLLAEVVLAGFLVIWKYYKEMKRK